MNKLLLITFYLMFTTIAAYSQSFRWGERGGSTQSASDAQVETIHDMAVDRNGNVYVLSRVYKTDISVGGQTIEGYGARDILLSSFDCYGNFRWLKLIGGSNSDYAYQVCTDMLDGVYVSFDMLAYNNVGNIDVDSVIPQNTVRRLYLVKYDTSGMYQWLRAPEPDTLTWFSESGSIDMDVDNSGNITWLCQLSNGVYGGAGGFVVNDTSDYILKYDRNGNFRGGIDLELDGAWEAGMAIDHVSKRIYVSGSGNGTPIAVGNTTITHSKFLVCFDDNGKYVWHRENTSLLGGLYGKPVLDNQGNIYVCGNTVSEKTTPPTAPADHFNGHTTQKGNGRATAIVYKVDKDGNNVWAVEAEVSHGVFARDIALRNSGEIVLLGSYPGSITWASEFPVPATGGGYDVFLARINTQTGRVLGVETINPTSGNESPRRIVSDGRNNVYIGSEFRGSVTVNGTQLNNSGGETDWFVAKFGHDNCNCTNIPEPKFSFTKNGLDVNFSYTGGPYSSIEWDFCDGSKSTQSNPTHTYLAKGIYTVCVKVTNNCGDNTYCDVVDFWPAYINEQVSLGNIKIYPNPASEILYIEGLEAAATIELFDIVGRKVKSMRTVNNRESINMSMLPPGNYIIHITNTDGHKMTGKISK